MRCFTAGARSWAALSALSRASRRVGALTTQDARPAPSGGTLQDCRPARRAAPNAAALKMAPLATQAVNAAFVLTPFRGDGAVFASDMTTLSAPLLPPSPNYTTSRRAVRSARRPRPLSSAEARLVHQLSDGRRDPKTRPLCSPRHLEITACGGMKKKWEGMMS